MHAHVTALKGTAKLKESPRPKLAPPRRTAPTMLDKARTLVRAMAAWQAAGRPVVSREIRKERLAICHACTHWNPSGNLGLGECGSPGCGCTKFKAYLATERCPLTPPKWGPVKAQ